MSKPLVLTIYDYGSRDRFDIFGPHFARQKADQMATAKRLTEPELAAEAYRQMVRAAGVAGIALLPNDEVVPADVANGRPLSKETQQLGVIKRFATSPHYFEVDQ